MERNMEMALQFPTLKLHTYYTLIHIFQLIHMPQDWSISSHS